MTFTTLHTIFMVYGRISEVKIIDGKTASANSKKQTVGRAPDLIFNLPTPCMIVRDRHGSDLNDLYEIT